MVLFVQIISVNSNGKGTEYTKSETLIKKLDEANTDD